MTGRRRGSNGVARCRPRNGPHRRRRWDPGWRATVDGVPAEVLRANHGFRAVAAPAGAHRIEMIYRPRPLVVGLAISAVGWLAVLACAVARARNASVPKEGDP